ncbi:nischarin isoform X1 [Hydra vulgaris]|uniref:nischarin isoform X1 n=1 Tax=Hydra vulgaris TaxID=6087 RepID=UPI001F5F3ECF|nr:nischarin [Hydra vulgaris]
MNNLNIKEHLLEWDSYPLNFHHNMVSIAEAVCPSPELYFNSISTKKNYQENTSDEKKILTQNLQGSRQKIKDIFISEWSKKDEYIVYKVEVHISELSWCIFRRYNEFSKLHEKLVQFFGIPNDLIPPKKLISNQDPGFINERRILLEKYLRNLINLFPNTPTILERFLEIEKFDVQNVCHQLAIDVFYIGNHVLSRNNIFRINLIQLHAINKSLTLPLSISDDKRADIGNLYSFVQNLKKLLIYPGILNKVFIGQKDLQCNLSIFKAVKYLVIHDCEIKLLQGIEHLQENLEEIFVYNSITCIKDIALKNVNWLQVSSNNESSHEIDFQFVPWVMLKRATFSYNNILHLDSSLKMFPSITHLNLSHNNITEVKHLEDLLCLTSLDLSFNVIRNVDEFSYKLPCIRSLNISANQLRCIGGLEKLYSLEELNISQNELLKITDVLLLGKLPLLRTLLVHNNPFTDVHNYREMIWASFSGRAFEISLDGHTPSKKELQRISKILEVEEQYVVIEDNIFSQHQISEVPGISFKDNLNLLTSATAAPKIKKKDHLVTISQSENKNSDFFDKKDADEVSLREQIEKLRLQAGDSWLTIYNEMLDSKELLMDDKATDNKEVVNYKEILDYNKESLSPFSTWNIDKNEIGLDDELIKEIEHYIHSHVDLNKETFLVTTNDGTFKERMITFDLKAKLMIVTDLSSGLQINTYNLGFVQNLKIVSLYKLLFNAKQSDQSWISIELQARTSRDAAGLYAVLKRYCIC